MQDFITQDTSEFNIIFIHSSLDDSGLTANQFRIYAHLSRRSNKKGKAWPGADSMAEVCRMHRETVLESIKELESRNMLRVQRRKGIGNVYELTPPSLWNQSEMVNGPHQSEMVNGVIGNGERHQSEMVNVSISNEDNPMKDLDNALRASSAETKRTAFDRFWLSYPKKLSKASAQKSFIRQKLHLNIEIILAALEQHKKTSQWEDPQYIPYPSKWLNNQRWEDDLSYENNRTNNSKGSGRNDNLNAKRTSQYAGIGRVQ